MIDVFTGFVARRYDSGTSVNEVELKDETLLLEETRVSGAFQNATPQEIIPVCRCRDLRVIQLCRFHLWPPSRAGRRSYRLPP